MKKTTSAFSVLLACSILFASCSSTTLIQSNPPKAKLHLDGGLVGETPYTLTDSKIVGSSTSVRIEKEGYKPLFTSISKDEEADVGAIIGGLFVWVPFLWLMKYKAVHNYELVPLTTDNSTQYTPVQNQNATSPRIARLRDLKKLLDDKIITQAEFDTEKAKILAEKE
jgi:hypothetical protein